MRNDVLEIIQYAYELGFELHMNTNSTLVDDHIAESISHYMKSVCTSILHSKEEYHDRMTGRQGAYKDVIRGIQTWRQHGVDVEVNVCTSVENYKDMYNIGALCAELGCYSLCSTRYILNDIRNKNMLLNSQMTMELIDLLLKVKSDFPTISDVSLPGPVPYCEVSKEYYEKLRVLNVPCQYGYGLARISPVGKVTPCTISDDVMGDLNISSFSEIWKSEKWKKYEQLCHIPENCRSCDELTRCKGGCVVYDESIIACGEKVCTKKWGY
jgi:radical SAM protein with 4Fe4S-binding SPASM domain